MRCTQQLQAFHNCLLRTFLSLPASIDFLSSIISLLIAVVSSCEVEPAECSRLSVVTRCRPTTHRNSLAPPSGRASIWPSEHLVSRDEMTCPSKDQRKFCSWVRPYSAMFSLWAIQPGVENGWWLCACPIYMIRDNFDRLKGPLPRDSETRNVQISSDDPPSVGRIPNATCSMNLVEQKNLCADVRS